MFKRLSLKQTKPTFSEGESPNLQEQTFVSWKFLEVWGVNIGNSFSTIFSHEWILAHDFVITFFFTKTTKGDINVVAFSTFYDSFTCKNVLIAKSVQKHTK